MTATDRAYLDGYTAALAIARTAADRIAAGPMVPLRKEMAAAALRSFADEAGAALTDAKHVSHLPLEPQAGE